MAGSCEFNVEILVNAKEATHAEHIHKDIHGYVTTDVYDVNVEGVTGLIKMEYPATLIKQAMGQTFTSKAAETRLEELKDALMPIPLKAVGNVPLMDMSFDKVMSLKEGDFIPLPSTTETMVSIAGASMYNAELFEQKDHLALNLTSSLFDADRFERIK